MVALPQAEQTEHTEILGSREPGAADQGGEMQRHGQVRQHPVVAVGLELGNDLLRRIAGIVRKQVVQQGNHRVDENQRDPQGPL